MEIQINGEPRIVSDVAHLAALIDSLGMKADRVAVELNLAIVPRTQWSQTPIKDGDKLEIVHFVGGGASTLGFTGNIRRPRLHFSAITFLFLVGFSVALVATQWNEFWDIDACIDRGGAWNYSVKSCGTDASGPTSYPVPPMLERVGWPAILLSLLVGAAFPIALELFFLMAYPPDPPDINS